VGITVAELVVSALLATGRFRSGLEQAVGQGSADAGWALPALSPHEIMGFTSTFSTFGGSLRWFAGTLLVCLTAATVVLFRRRAAARLAGAAVAMGFASYAAVYAIAGESYQQWKWAAFVAPMIVVASMSLLLRVVQPVKWRAAVAVAVLLVLMVNVVHLTRSAFRLDNETSFVSPELRDVARDADVKANDALALRVDSWSAMWLTAMLPNTRTYHFSFWGYYPVERVADVPMVERIDDATPPQLLRSADQIDGEFRLVVRDPSKLGATVEVLDHTATAVKGEQISWRVRVRNAGPVAWQPGSTSLRISLVGSTWTVADPLVDVPIDQGVRPGETRELSGVLVNPEDRNFALQFDPVVDGRPLQIWSESSLAPVVVDANAR
jgi:hypothetical protein